MTDSTPDPAEQPPADMREQLVWLADHPGKQRPLDGPDYVFTINWLWRAPPGLPGDWRKHLVLLWSIPAPDAIAYTPEWAEMRWTGEYTPRDGLPVPMIIDRIHVLYFDSRAWIEGVRNTDGGDFTITLRGLERCRSEGEGRRVLRGWKYILFEPGGGGRKEGDRTGTLTTTQIQAIEDAIVTLYDGDPSHAFRWIADYLNEQYPPALYERKRWNYTTASDWYKRGKKRLEGNGRKIDDAASR